MTTITVPSDSDSHKRYSVDLSPPDSAYPTCTCVAFAIARNRARKEHSAGTDVRVACKHIKAVGSGNVGVESTTSVRTRQPSVAPDMRPMLSSEVAADTLPRYVQDPAWWFQMKADGHRLLLNVEGGKSAALGRGGQVSQHSGRFTQPSYAGDIGRLPDCVLDGELVDNTLWVFDLPSLPNKGITTATPYSQRHQALEELFADWSPGAHFRLLSTAKTELQKAELALNCLKAGAEGVMVKDIMAPYEGGARSSRVLKAKFVKELDAVVTSVGENGKNNYGLSVYRDGELVEVGRCSAIGKVRCEVGDVVTVRFLYFAVNDRLYQPRLICKRTDKSAAECLWSQLDHARVNKAVLA